MRLEGYNPIPHFGRVYWKLVEITKDLVEARPNMVDVNPQRWATHPKCCKCACCVSCVRWPLCQVRALAVANHETPPCHAEIEDASLGNRALAQVRAELSRPASRVRVVLADVVSDWGPELLAQHRERWEWTIRRQLGLS